MWMQVLTARKNKHQDSFGYSTSSGSTGAGGSMSRLTPPPVSRSGSGLATPASPQQQPPTPVQPPQPSYMDAFTELQQVCHPPCVCACVHVCPCVRVCMCVCLLAKLRRYLQRMCFSSVCVCILALTRALLVMHEAPARIAAGLFFSGSVFSPTGNGQCAHVVRPPDAPARGPLRSKLHAPVWQQQPHLSPK